MVCVCSLTLAPSPPSPMPPTLAPGKICHVEIPAIDERRSADFYETVFSWQIRRRGDGALAFDDTVGEVSGTWVTGRPPSREAGLVFYVMVESVQATLDRIVEAGGEVVTPFTPQGPGEAFATFRDPAGNILGIGQQP
jgi:predicted enzyme related to lactoylglutathione lyase